MARVIVLDLAGQQIRILEADTRPGRLLVRRTTTLTGADGADTASESLHGQLRDALAHESKGVQVVGLIGRTSAVLRDLRVPDAPSEEMAGIVQFQAMRELSFPVEQAAIDYEVVGPPESDGQRRVLLAALQQDVVERCRAAANAAGMTLTRLGLRPYATWRTYRHGAGALMPAGAVLVVSLAGEVLELTVARGDTVLFSRATMLKTPADAKPAAAEPTAALVAEVRRTLAAFGNQVPGVAVERVALAAGADQYRATSDALAGALDTPVDRFDPFQAVELSGDRGEDPGAFVAAIGAALAMNEPWPIDFLNTKKPVVPRDRRKPIALAAAAAAVLMLAGAFALAQLKLATGSRKISGLVRLQSELTQNLKKGNDVVREAQEIERWLDAGVDCLGTLENLSERHPDTRDMFTASVSITHDGSPNGTTKIDLDGFAKQTSVIGQFYTRLKQGDKYSAQPAPGPVQAGSRGGGDYKTSFRSQIVEKSDSADAASTGESVAPPPASGRPPAASRELNPLQAGKKSSDQRIRPAANKK